MYHHPCFEKKFKSTHARVHLPVAKHCNIQCGYCKITIGRGRTPTPGSSQKLLSPEAAVKWLLSLQESIHNISVVGIAGPGDPLASLKQTMDTFNLVKRYFPQVLLCLSTNGLLLVDHLSKLIAVGVKHITITKNAVSSEVASNIYRHITLNGNKQTGKEVSRKFLKIQRNAIKLMVKNGIHVKVNTVLIPGINEHEVPEVAKEVSSLGAQYINIIPLIKIPGSYFSKIGVNRVSKELLKKVVRKSEKYARIMKHCNRCSADAAGFLK